MEAVAPTWASALKGCSGRRRTDRSQDCRAAEKDPQRGGGNVGLGPVLAGLGWGA